MEKKHYTEPCGKVTKFMTEQVMLDSSDTGIAFAMALFNVEKAEDLGSKTGYWD
ncbi:MAG: hypothetical protein MJ078_00710 [Clostridia bacterium]|nr:hypothetical protein [Clostridia bacterium]